MSIDALDYLPHLPPMVMITDGEDLASGEAAAWADTSENSVFYVSALDGVPGCAALEYMAQTMAFAVGAQARRRGEQPKIGFILGSRRLEVAIPVFRRGEKYRIHVKCEYTDEEFGSFDCEIADAHGKVVANGTLTAFQPETTPNKT